MTGGKLSDKPQGKAPEEILAAARSAKAEEILARARAAQPQAEPPPQARPPIQTTPDMYGPVQGRRYAASPDIDAPATTDTAMDAVGDTAMGAAEGASLGFAPQIGATAAAPFSDKKWTDLRNIIQERQALAAKRSPVLHAAGQAAGGAALTAATGGLGAEALGGKLATGTVGRLALEGAVAGAGQARGDDPNGVAQPKDYLFPVLAGSAASVGGGKLLQKGANILGLGSKEAAKTEADQATRAADRARVAVANIHPDAVASTPGGIERQAATMREQGVGGGTFNTSGDVETQALQSLEKIKNSRKLVVVQAQRKGMLVPGQEVADRLRAKANMIPGEDSEVLAAKAELERIAKGYEGNKRLMSFMQADAERAHYENGANWSSDSPTAAVRKDVHTALNDIMEKTLETREPGTGKVWRNLGKQAQGVINALESTQTKLGRTALGQQPSAGGKLAAGMGAVKAGAPGAGVASVLNWGSKNYGHSVAASVKERAARVAQDRAQRTARLADSVIGRALQHQALPTSQTVGRLEASSAPRHVLADQGAQAVQNAPTPEAQAKEHFMQSQTNPDYRMDVARPGER